MTKLDKSLILDIVRCFDQIYNGTLFAINCRIRNRYFELLYYTRKKKLIEVRLVSSEGAVRRMMHLMKQKELIPDHLYLVVREKEIIENSQIPSDIGIILLDNTDLRLLRKSRVRKGSIPHELFFKRVSDTMVGLLNKGGE